MGLPVCKLRSGNQCNQLAKIPPVQRELIDKLLLNHLAEHVARSFHERHVFRSYQQPAHSFFYLGDFEIGR
jgi:hypothetical protein